MKRAWSFVIGGVIVVGGVITVSLTRSPQPVATTPVVHHHHKPLVKTHPKPHHKPQPQKSSPTRSVPRYFPAVGSATGTVTASFQAVVGQAPPVPLQVVTLPWQTTTQWAVEPLGMRMYGSDLATLWFGERTGTGPWTWIPSTLPHPLSTKLPPAIRDSLIMGYDLKLGDPGTTNTVGTITWQGLQGNVSNPHGWTLGTDPADDSPLFAPTVSLSLYQQAYTKNYTGYYGMQLAFDQQTARTGLHSLVGFIAPKGSIVTIVSNPEPLL